jgi:hypothetical protein
MSDSALIQIAFHCMPCDPPVIGVLGETLTFIPDPDGSASWIAEGTEEHLASLLSCPGYSRWTPPAPTSSAVTPDKTWSVMGIVAYAQEQFGLVLNPKRSKDELLAAILAAQSAANAPTVASDAPSAALTAIQAAEAALKVAEAATAQ